MANNEKQTSLLESLFLYLKHPRYDIKISTDTNARKLKEILRLISVSFAAVFILGILSSFLAYRAGYDQTQNHVVDLFLEKNILIVLLLALVWAPLAEEMTFRLGMRVSPYRLSFALGFFSVMLFDTGFYLFHENIRPLPEKLFLAVDHYGIFIYALAILLIGAGLGRFLGKRADFKRVEDFYQANFVRIFFFFSIAFGLLHIMNYYNILAFWYLIPVLVIPQFAVGLVLGYVRMRYGMAWAVLKHFLYNGLLLIPFAAFSFLSAAFLRVLETEEDPEKITAAMTEKDATLLLLIGIYFIALISFVIVSAGKSVWEYVKSKRKIT